MNMTVYTVWCEGTGDIFKGYNNKYISTHLDERVAKTVARINSGWVEEMEDICHEDYINQLKEQDVNLRAAHLRVSSAMRDMLAYGG